MTIWTSNGRFTIEAATHDDYLALRDHHYVEGDPATFATVLRAMWGNILAGVMVVSHAMLNADWRGRAFGGAFDDGDNTVKAGLTNKHVRAISRVIVEPRFRGNGIATALVRHYLTTPLTPCTEATSVLNAFVPLFERAGMKRIDLPPSMRDRALTCEMAELHLTALDLAAMATNCGLTPSQRESLRVLLPALERWGQSHRGTRRLTCPTTLARYAARSLILPRVVFVHGRLPVHAAPGAPARLAHLLPRTASSSITPPHAPHAPHAPHTSGQTGDLS